MGFAIGIVMILFVAGLALWVWALVDAIQVRDDAMYRNGNKLIWVLVIVLAGVIGAIVYLAVGRPTPGSAPPQLGPPSGSLPPPPPV
jgi:hypothetical protein